MNIASITHPDPRVQRAGRKYAAALLNHTNPNRGDGNLREQVQNFMESSERYHVMVRRMREVLDELAIPQAMGLVYRNFGLRVLKVMDRFALRTRHILVLEAVDRALMYGCDRQVLFRISREVLDYDIDKMAAELGMGA